MMSITDSANAIDIAKVSFGISHDIAWQQKGDWQAPESPFMSFEFWQVLMKTGAIGKDAGWWQFFVEVYQQDELLNNKLHSLPNQADKNENNHQNGKLVAVMPVFIKDHHRGEFVFDYRWAQAFDQVGADYYPRLVTAVPFSPITGERVWLTVGTTLNDSIITALIAGIDAIAKQVQASSWHGLFVNQDFCQKIQNNFPSEVELKTFNPESMAELPIFERQGCQFLWRNQQLPKGGAGFASFEEFLATFTAKRRRAIKAERRKVAAQGLICRRKVGTEISADDWEVFYHCYVMTYAVRGQLPYLTLDFFKQLAKRLPQHLMLAQALDDNGEIVASSLFLFDADSKSANSRALYGRYWGALSDFDSLHFELCYYQGIEFAIERGLAFFDPGTQGEHKLIRGFIPTATHSLHRIYDPRFVPAIGAFCDAEREQMRLYREDATTALPFNQDNLPSQLF